MERLAVVWAGAILRAHAPTAVADAFIRTRIAGRSRSTYGTGLDAAGADVPALLQRVLAE